MKYVKTLCGQNVETFVTLNVIANMKKRFKYL